MKTKPRQKKYKVSTLWWIGWVVTWPLRFFAFGITAPFIVSMSPEFWYGWLNNRDMLEKDQSKWR